MTIFKASDEKGQMTVEVRDIEWPLPAVDNVRTVRLNEVTGENRDGRTGSLPSKREKR
jgi:hypothetical protein